MVLILSGFIQSSTSSVVSVPLRGLWFLSYLCKYERQQACCQFPSPCGDYGSYRMGLIMELMPPLVSVPLRGLWFLSFSGVIPPRLPLIDRFRPLAGIMVLITKKQTRLLRIYNWFPSPCGDYGSYLAEGDAEYGDIL